MDDARTGPLARMPRLLLRIAVLASSALFAAIVILWARSFRTDDLVIWHRSSGDTLIAGGCRGQILLGRSLYPGIDERRRDEPIGVTHHASAARRGYLAEWALDPVRTRVLHEGTPDRPSPLDTRIYFDHSAFRNPFLYAGFVYQEGMRRSLDGRGRLLASVVTSRFLIIPFWALALAASAGPLTWAARRIRFRRTDHPRSAFPITPSRDERREK